MALILPHSVMIHIPKTGGSWCAEAIKKAGIKCEEPRLPGSSLVQSRHCSIRAVADRVGDKLTFAFIRHPFTWLRSQWCYINDRGAYKKWRPPLRHWTAQCWSTDFVTFVENVLTKHPAAPSNAMLKRIGYTVKNKKLVPGPVAVKFIGKTESLREDLGRALTKAGEKFDPKVLRDLAPVRKSKTRPNRDAPRELEVLVESGNKYLMALWSSL
jgi:hypothetical protein